MVKIRRSSVSMMLMLMLMPMPSDFGSKSVVRESLAVYIQDCRH
jgi:hypothetical protein